MATDNTNTNAIPSRGGDVSLPDARIFNIPAVASGCAIGAGILVLTGWALDLDPLKQVLPDLVSMNPLTAICFVLAGISLGLSSSCLNRETGFISSDSLLLKRISAALVFGFGTVILSQYLFGWETKIDQWLFQQKLLREEQEFPNQMAPNTALSFVFLGAALLLLDTKVRRGPRLTEVLGLAIGLISLLALIGYIYQVSGFYGIGIFIPMALHTAAVFFVLALGLLWARRDQGLMKLVTSQNPGGRLVRQLFPAMVTAMILLGWLRLEGERRGFYDDELGVTLYTVANILVIGGLIGWSGRSLRRADLARAQMETERDRFFTLSLDLLGIAETNGYFKRVNPAFSRTLGYSTEEFLARPFLDFVHPDDRERTCMEMEKLRQGAPTIRFKNRYRCRDGSWKWLSWRVQPYHEENLLYATARDVSEDIAAENEIAELNTSLQNRAAQLQTANKELESFSYSVSHDLRAPLRHIHGYVEMLTKATEGKLDEKPRRYLKTITEASREMGELIDDLLSFSRMGRVGMSEASIRLGDLVGETIRGIPEGEKERNIEWKIADLPEVVGDYAMLKQVFANLIENAVKYSRNRDPSIIEVGAAGGKEGRLVFFVRDNGAGFDMQYVDKLFGVFQRLHRADEFEGTGIGLANVRRIISRHGGETWAEGKPNQGATFYFTLKPVKSDHSNEDS